MLTVMEETLEPVSRLKLSSGNWGNGAIGLSHQEDFECFKQ